jgi:hypothetical protein
LLPLHLSFHVFKDQDQEKFVAVQISYVWRRIAEIRHALGKDDIYKKTTQKIFRSAQNTTILKIISQRNLLLIGDQKDMLLKNATFE